MHLSLKDAKHAVVALRGLKTPENIVKNFYEFYTKEQTLFGYHVEKSIKSEKMIHRGNWDMYLGKKIFFSDFCDYFEQEINKTGLDVTLQKYLPVLVEGCAGALLHGYSHLHVDSKDYYGVVKFASKMSL